MDSILNCKHLKFKYIWISDDTARDVEERTFEGLEKDFQEVIKRSTITESLKKSSKDSLKTNLLKDMEKNSAESGVKLNSEELLDNVINTSSIDNMYQIVPLVMPSQNNNHICVNMYVDNTGQYKSYSENVRASRIASTNVKGPVIISSSFDDDNEFKRVDFDKNSYELMLQKPPSAENRWSMEKMYKNMLKQNSEPQEPKVIDPLSRCNNCYEPASKVKLYICAKCRKVAYCGVDCQKTDWPIHRKFCS